MNTVKSFTTSRGDSPTYDFINSLKDPQAQKRIFKALKKLEINGHQRLLLTAEAKKLHGHKNLYELRIRHKNIQYRIFFSIKDNTYWLTHGFTKKSQKTPNREIKKALNIIKIFS